MNLTGLSERAPQVLSLLRIVAGLMFMQHGTQKIFGFPEAARGPFELMSQMGIGGGAGTGRRRVDRIGPVHPTGRLYPVGHDGRGLLPVPRAEQPLSAGQSGRTGGDVLLGVLLSRLRRTGRLEPRCDPRPEGLTDDLARTDRHRCRPCLRHGGPLVLDRHLDATGAIGLSTGPRNLGRHQS